MDRAVSKDAILSAVRRLVSGQDGAELVEFSISIFFWISFFFAVVYFSMALYTEHYVASAAHDAARYAVVRGATWAGTSCSSSSLACAATSSDVSSYLLAALPPAIDARNLTITTTWPGTDTAGNTCDNVDGNNSRNCIVQVKVDYAFKYPLPFVNLRALNMSSTAKMTIVN